MAGSIAAPDTTITTAHAINARRRAAKAKGLLVETMPEFYSGAVRSAPAAVVVDIPAPEREHWSTDGLRRRRDFMKISARNQLRGTVTAITRGEATANVVLDVKGERLVASITVEAVRELGIEEGSEVTAVVKASDVLLAVD